MKKIEIEVPESFSKIDPKLNDELFVRTLRKLAAENLKEKRKELKEVKLPVALPRGIKKLKIKS